MFKKKVSTITLLLAVLLSLLLGYWGGNYAGHIEQRQDDIREFHASSEYSYYMGEYNMCYSFVTKIMLVKGNVAVGACLGLVRGMHSSGDYGKVYPYWNWKFISDKSEEVQTP